MNNIIRTLSLTLGLGLFLAVAQPAHAEFFPEPFQNDTHVTAPAQAPATVTEQTEKLQIRIAPVPQPAISDPQWSAPLSNPTPYAPMGRVQTAPAATTASSSAPIAVPGHDLQAVDNWQAPLSSPTTFEPMR